MQKVSSKRFCGRTLNGDEVDQIKEIVRTCKGISRTELASTVCELFVWHAILEILIGEKIGTEMLRMLSILKPSGGQNFNVIVNGLQRGA